MPESRWPSAASIHYDDLPGCSGVLVHPELVLTAGHCASETLDAVALGGVDLDDPAGFEWLDVEEVHTHDDHWNTNDVSVLVLSEPATTSPARLALGCAAAFVVDGAAARIVGFGNTETDGGGATSLLHEADVEIVAADCQDASRGCNVGFNDLIAGGEGVDTCVGDSGGPLFLWGPDGQTYLAATTSRAALPSTRTCGDGGIYVRVDGLAEWIEEVSGLSLETPDCGEFENTPPQPAPLRMSLRVGETATELLSAEDPDPGQVITWSLAAPATLGTATLEEATLTYEAREEGEESLLIEVDDGIDAVDLEVPVSVSAAPPDPVVDPEPRNGCAHAPGGRFWVVLLGGAWLVGRGSASDRARA